ncbi:MAG: RNA-binding domain-containing protein [Methanothermobacter sp.]
MIHNISYRVMVHGTEDEEKVIKALKKILPTASPQKEKLEGHHGNPLTLLKGKITDKKTIKDFTERIKPILGKLDIERHVDEAGNLFLRLDKQRAYNGEWKLVKHGDSIHLKLKIEAYPARREVAIKNIKKLIT